MAVFQRFRFRHAVVFTFSNSGLYMRPSLVSSLRLWEHPTCVGNGTIPGCTFTRSVGRRGIRSDCCLMPQVQGPTASVFAYGFSS